ncbi:MAG: asparagine synthetase B, partial [bacterium]|nr:asparagine synthetase B [bacterium]
MCGICGIYHTLSNEPIDPGLLTRMTRVLAHRGPDGEGFHVDGPVGLGHRRLSIIDVEGGAQPLSNEDGTVWITFNGEIYNFKELARELQSLGHRFRSRSDTEVLVHGYEEWGDDVVLRLNGMFAFGLWDARKRRMLLARDHFGVKPLYYFHDGQRLIFASELKAI